MEKIKKIIDEIRNLSIRESFIFQDQFREKYSLAHVSSCSPIICFSRGKYEVFWMTPKGLCEDGSPVAESFPRKDKKLFEKISLLVDTFQLYLLGEEGIKKYIDTMDDRRLVDALSHGANMDMETGIITDHLTGEEI